MDWLDRFNRRLGTWYQSHFGVAEDSEISPPDVLRKLIEAMEEFRNEGIDGRVYVPNRYVLEIAVLNRDERTYLLAFLDEQELTAALEDHMSRQGYLTRGPLDFTIEELEAIPGEEKLYIRALFDKNPPARPASAASEPANAPSFMSATPARITSSGEELIADDITVYGRPRHAAEEDPPTVHAPPGAWGALLVTGIDGQRSLSSLTKQVFCVGRSRHSGNDLVLADDGQVSKRHLRIEHERDGGATLYDLASTNGTFVNGKLVPVNAALKHGDLIEIGNTRIEFLRDPENAPVASALSWSQSPFVAPSAPPAEQAQPVQTPSPPERPTAKIAATHYHDAPPTARIARLTRVADGSAHMLGLEALVGRSLTSDIVVSEPTVSAQQARVLLGKDGIYTVHDLSGRGTTVVNSRPLRIGEEVSLQSGDRLNFGGVAFVFVVE